MSESSESAHLTPINTLTTFPIRAMIIMTRKDNSIEYRQKYVLVFKWLTSDTVFLVCYLVSKHVCVMPNCPTSDLDKGHPTK